MTLVETNPDETDRDFCAAVDGLLQAISPDRPRWWHPYEVRGTYECRGIRFRHFYCIAGSVEGWLWLIANKGGSRRVILLSDESSTVFGPVKMYGRGEQVIIKADEVQAVPSGWRRTARALGRTSARPMEHAMNWRITREVRSWFWMWWAVMVLASLIPLGKLIWADADADRLEAIGVIGFFGGAALLSAAAFSPAQRPHDAPVGKLGAADLWTRKALLLAAAVLCAGAVACFVQTILGNVVWAEFKIQDAVEPVLLLVILVCSVAGWTLVARSAVRGVLLSGVVLVLLYLLIVAVVTAIDQLAPAGPGAVRTSHTTVVHTVLRWMMVAVGLGYAVFMLRLGRRKFTALEPARLPAA